MLPAIFYITLAIFIFGVGFFYVRYPGFVKFVGNQLRFASWRENKNLLLMNRYWLEFMEKLRLNASTGIYGFDEVAKFVSDDFELGKIEYHRGNFTRAITLIEKSMHGRGKAEQKLFWLAISHMRNAEAENCLCRSQEPAVYFPAKNAPQN